MPRLYMFSAPARRAWWVFHAAFFFVCPTVARAVLRICVCVRLRNIGSEVATDCWTGTQLSQLSACQIWRPNFETCFSRFCRSGSGNSACQTVAGMFPGSTASGWQLCHRSAKSMFSFPVPMQLLFCLGPAVWVQFGVSLIHLALYLID